MADEKKKDAVEKAEKKAKTTQADKADKANKPKNFDYRHRHLDCGLRPFPGTEPD